MQSGEKLVFCIFYQLICKINLTKCNVRVELDSTNRPVGDYVNQTEPGVTPTHPENQKKGYDWENRVMRAWKND